MIPKGTYGTSLIGDLTLQAFLLEMENRIGLQLMVYELVEVRTILFRKLASWSGGTRDAVET